MINSITVKAGKPLIELAMLCWKANRPFMVEGRHGIGKSEILEQAARAMGIGFVSCDLSLMEPPDLVGLPMVNNGVTVYAPPAFLPREGAGLVVVEELNRAPRFMQAPCLQLLTARKLHTYELPPRWLPVGAINPVEDGYDVSELDLALASRFVNVRVVPDRDEWLIWAKGAGVHADVVEYVDSDPTVFDAPQSNPRAWAYVSDILHNAESSRISTLRAAVFGLVGLERGAAFLASLNKSDKPLAAGDILAAFSKHRRRVQAWIKAGHLELVQATMFQVLRHIQPEPDFKTVRGNQTQWRNLARFLYDLPGDLRQQANEVFADRGYEFPTNPDAKSGEAAA